MKFRVYYGKTQIKRCTSCPRKQVATTPSEITGLKLFTLETHQHFVKVREQHCRTQTQYSCMLVSRGKKFSFLTLHPLNPWTDWQWGVLGHDETRGVSSRSERSRWGVDGRLWRAVRGFKGLSGAVSGSVESSGESDGQWWPWGSSHKTFHLLGITCRSVLKLSAMTFVFILFF